MIQNDKKVAQSKPADANLFVFGVSGHRDLVRADLPALRAQLREIFARYRDGYPDALFQLLSPLAEGADRIAAEEAVASGVELVVPLPMAQAEYERDFAAAESLADFRRLLETAESRFEVAQTSSGESSLPDGGDARTGRYAAVGDYIARNSNVLLLLWDGKENHKVGGTAWVKKRREYWTQLSESGDYPRHVETIHLVVRREKPAN